MITADYLEGRLIGSAMKFPEILPLVSPSDFRLEQSQILWRSMRDCHNTYAHLDLYTLRDHIKQKLNLDLTDTLVSYEEMGTATLQLAENTAQMLLNENRRIRVDEGIVRLSEMSAPVDAKIQALREIMDAAAPRVIKITKSMKDNVRSVIEQMDHLFQKGGLPGVSTGLPMLDQVLGGLQNQDLNIIAARPSMGKTAFAVNIALHSPGCAFISAEQPAEQLTQRMIAIIGSIPAHKLRNPRMLEDYEWGRITEAAKTVSELPLQIMDAPSPTIEEVTAWATKAVESGAGWICVDYLQRLKASDRKMNDYQRISHIARELKELARTTNVPVVALAQINRQGAGQARMEHLKGSGDIEQEADVIAILERDLENDQTSGSLNLEKNRHGPIVDIPLHFDALTMRFGEAYREQ